MPLSSSSLRRSAAVAALPLRAAGRSAGVQFTRLTRGDYAARQQQARSATAVDTREVLGNLKGGALKVGQLLSTVDSLFPQDPDGSWRQALTALQENNPALPFAEVEPVLADDLGPRWPELFTEFDTTAVAAASIGQVHSAVWHDGTPVAVKVQYPGAAEALAADIRSLSAVLRLTSLIAPGVAMPPLIAELRMRLREELDYTREATHQHRFAVEYRDDPEIAVPEVIAASHRVLVSRWLAGRTFAELATAGTNEDRNRAGTLYQRFFLTSPTRVGLLHTDPHPGNFRLTEDDRLGVMDFGSSLPTPDGLPPSFGGLIGALLAGDPEQIERRLRRDRFIKPGKTLEVNKLIDYMSPFTEPARHDTFAFTPEWLHTEFTRTNDPRNPDFAVAMKLNMPAELLFTHRVWLGVVGVLSGLRATVPVRPELMDHLPGFAAAMARHPAS